MLVKNIMTEPVICCTPRDSVRYAAALMAFHSVGALPVVSDLNDPLFGRNRHGSRFVLPGSGGGRSPEGYASRDVMTRVPVTCEPHDDLNKCLDGRGTVTLVLKTLARTPKRTGTLQVSA